MGFQAASGCYLRQPENQKKDGIHRLPFIIHLTALPRFLHFQAAYALQNTTRRSIVARALVVPCLQRVAHGLQRGDFLVELGDVFARQLFDIAAVPFWVVCQRQQAFNLRQRKAHFARVGDKAQPLQIDRQKTAITRFAAWRGRQQALFFIIADLFGG